jgi:hypothetical protein
MDDKQFKKLQKMMETTIKLTVNGKIDRIDAKLEQHFKGDREWKEAAMPAIELGNNARGFGKTAAYFIGVMGSIALIITALIDALKFKK